MKPPQPTPNPRGLTFGQYYCWATMRIAAKIVGLFLLFTPGAPGQILFESDYGSSTINRFVAGGAPSLFTAGLAPTGLAFDNAGNLFAGDIGGGGANEGRILRFAPDGSSSIFASGLWGPFALAFDSRGALFAADYNNNINQYTPQGARTIFASGLSGPVGLAFDATGNLFVSEWNNGNINRFTPHGVRSTFASGFTRPSGLAFDSAGNLFVVENGNPLFTDSGAVYKITPGGVSTMMASGMFGPTSLAFDTEGNFYVTDTWNGRILEFSPDGTENIYASGLNLPTYLAFQPIPEPSAVVLLLVGGSTLFLLRRTRHGQKVFTRTSNAWPNHLLSPSGQQAAVALHDPDAQ